MGNLRFKVTAILPLIAEARAAEAHKAAEPAEILEDFSDPPGEGAGPAILLVHDLSVYLMSSARLAEPQDVPRQVAYADGLDPRESPSWVERCASLVGHDHFAEAFPLEPLEALCAAAPDGWIQVELCDPRVRLSAINAGAEGVLA